MKTETKNHVPVGAIEAVLAALENLGSFGPGKPAIKAARAELAALRAAVESARASDAAQLSATVKMQVERDAAMVSLRACRAALADVAALASDCSQTILRDKIKSVARAALANGGAK